MITGQMTVGNNQRVLEAQANKILARAGYFYDGRLKTAKRESVKAVSVPCGGKPGYRKR